MSASTVLRDEHLTALLGEVLDLLAGDVSEWASEESDVNDGPGGEDGPDLVPNRAMRVQSILNDNPDNWNHGGRGLLTRVREAWMATK